MTTAAQTLEVLARDHAAVADEDNAPEPETTLQIVNDARHCPHIAPIAGKHMMGNRPTIDQHQADEHLWLTRLAIPTVAMRGQTRWPVAFKIGGCEIIEHDIHLQGEQIPQGEIQLSLDRRFALQ